MNILKLISEFNLYSVLVRLVLAVVLGGIIGLERGRHGRAAGLRTHILVCLGAALTSLIGLYASNVLGSGGDVLRVSAQVVSGIGFLGVGMILVRNHTVITGLTTAAGLWTTAVIGIAVGFGFYSASFIAAFGCVIVTSLLGYFESKGKTVTNLYLEISSIKDTRRIVSKLRDIIEIISVDTVSPKSNIEGNIGVTVLARSLSVTEETLLLIENIEEVVFVVEE